MTISAAAVLSGAAPAAPAAAAGGDPNAAPPAGGAPAATPANDPWYAKHPDESIRNWAANKGWQDPMAALESGYNLEKLIGFEKAGRTVVMPKDDATPEERAAFFQKLGAPQKADGYKLPETLAQDPLAKKFQEVAHKNGMLPKQFEETLNWYQGEAQAMQAQQQTQRAAQSEQDMTALKGEWGQAYDKQIELAKRAAGEFLPAKTPQERQDMLAAIENAVGTGAMLRFFARVGEGLGEHAVHSSGEAGGFDAMTPAQARSRIDALKSDREWADAYLKGDAGKRAEMERLIKFAYPQQA